MRFKRAICLVAQTALLLGGMPAHVAAQTEWPNCENFRDQDEAQAAYDADRADPFALESSEPVNDVPCEDEPAFGTEPLVSCDALTDYPDAQQALQGLYDHTRDGGDPYGLDQGGASGSPVVPWSHPVLLSRTPPPTLTARKPLRPDERTWSRGRRTA
jgi:hypothetical protein